MEKKIILDLNALPYSLITEEIYEVVGELIHLTVIFDNGWEFCGVITKQNLANLSNISLTVHNGTLFTLTIPSESEEDD